MYVYVCVHLLRCFHWCTTEVFVTIAYIWFISFVLLLNNSSFSFHCSLLWTTGVLFFYKTFLSISNLYLRFKKKWIVQFDHLFHKRHLEWQVLLKKLVLWVLDQFQIVMNWKLVYIHFKVRYMIHYIHKNKLKESDVVLLMYLSWYEVICYFCFIRWTRTCSKEDIY